MVQRNKGRASQQLEALWTAGTMTGLTDTQLLRRFVETRDAIGELAFVELLNRHGPMVWGVCRQILPRSHDADDAFQATFLVLVRKARSIREGESLGPWLYRVAYRTAQRARANASRYRPGTDEQFEGIEASPEDAYRLDARPLLYEELDRLPGKYQVPIVLCHLEGKTHEEAARLLNWPVGTLSGRLSRGRQLLRSRLERRGVTVPSALLCVPWLVGSQSPAMATLVEAALRVATRFAAAQTIPASVLSLTQGVLKTMILRKLGTVTAAVLLVGVVTGGAGAWMHRPSLPQESEPASVSRQNADTPPVSKPNAAPESKPQSSTDGVSRLADNCPSDCPLTESDRGNFGCPIAMATHAISKMFGSFHDRSVASK